MRIAFLLCIVLAGSLFSQSTMEVIKTAGGNESFAISAISKITFTATDMVVAGPGRSIPIDNIRVILFTNVTAVENGSTPALFSFENISPNPFNPETGIRFSLVRDGKVAVAVYSMAGKKVRDLKSGALKAGFYEIAWNGADDSGRPLAAGSYVVRLKLDGKTINKKAVLLR